MVARTTLKLSFVVVAACAVILGFVAMGEMTLRWLRPADGTHRLKLQIVASPEIYIAKTPVRDAVKPAKLTEPASEPSLMSKAAAAPPSAPLQDSAMDSASAAEVPAPTDPTVASVSTPGPFDAVGDKSMAPAIAPSSPQSLAYAEPPPANASLASPGAPPTPPADAALAAPSAADSAGTAVASLNPPARPDTATDLAPAPTEPPRTSRSATFKASMTDPGTAGQGQSLRILQIGDSHTAADFFTGEVRERLQAIYGDGGAGYLVVGRPNPGVRSEILKMTVSPGWAYTAIQKSDDSSQFHLSGFNAIASKPGETLTLTTDAPVRFDSIDIEVKHGPDSGAVELRFDNDQAVKFDLAGPKPEWWFLRATSQRNHVEQLKQLSIKTLDGRPVNISSVAIFNQTYGVSYSAIGFPGATIDIVNRFPEDFFIGDLQHIDPQIVVLAFGTNEGFNDVLDVPKYGERYQQAINRIRTALPNAQIVLVGPANANRLPRNCRSEGAMCRVRTPNEPETQACVWETPPKLDRVREMQKLIAKQDHIYYWNWSEVMPADCGAHQWATASPRLMQPDHVHFTAEGYKLGADKFADFLIPIIEKLRLSDRVVSNN